MRYVRRSLLALAVIAGAGVANTLADVSLGLFAGLLGALVALVALVVSRLQVPAP